MPENDLPNLKEYSVSELAGAVKRALETGFPFVKVRGELGRISRPPSGHVYLDLKDANATLAGVIWRSAAQRLKITPEEGMEVVATGRISAFEGSSKYQLIIDSLEPAGVGALMALLEARKKKLAAEGLFAPERKRPIPYLPGTIGVVTSPSGAVIRDILHRLRERFPRRVLVWPTPVQGKGAELKIAAAIEGFNSLPERGDVPRPDVLIVARGGGSLEDLWCFNEEIVARAVAASRIPVISAVGHETDTTLIDYVADIRAPTPTAAAEKAVPMRSDLAARLATIGLRLVKTMARAAEHRDAALRAAVRGLGRPEGLLGPKTQRFDRAADRLSGAGARVVERKLRALAELRLAPKRLRALHAKAASELAYRSARLSQLLGLVLAAKAAALEAAGKLLSSLSYENVLERGFALVQTPAGRLVASAAEAKSGSQVTIRFRDGARGAVIDGDPRGKRRGGLAGQSSLFD